MEKKLQLPFNHYPLFQQCPRSQLNEWGDGDFKIIYEAGTTSYTDMLVLFSLLYLANKNSCCEFEVSKKELGLLAFQKERSGWASKRLKDSLNKWSSTFIHTEGKKMGVVDCFYGEHSFYQIGLDPNFYQEALARGKVYDLEEVRELSGLQFRLIQVLSGMIHKYPKLKFDPSTLVDKVPISLKRYADIKRRLLPKVAFSLEWIGQRETEINFAVETINGKRWFMFYRGNLVEKYFREENSPPPIKKGPVQFGELEAVQCGASENFISDVYTEKEKVTCQNQPLSKENSTTEYEKSQGEFDQACSFYESISRDFDRRSLSGYADSVAINWNWHKEAIKFCASGQLATRQYSGKKIVGWYKSGSLKNEFQSYVDEQHKILAKKRREEQTPELKEEMFETMLSLLKSSTEEGKQELADSICEYRDTTDIYTAENRFREQAILKCLESPKMSKYNKPGYDDLINTLFRWDEFGKHMEKNLQKSWYPEFNLKHKIERGNNKPKLVEEVPEWKKKENAKFRLLQAAERRIKEAAQ